MSHGSESAVTLRCPAKLNLALSVGSPDAHAGGLHPIASWMVAIDLCDELRVRRVGAGERSEFDIGFAGEAPLVQAVDWPMERDLAVRAHAAMERESGRRLPVAVTLRKRIPAGAGLGGGSADAAGMLLAVDRLFEVYLSPRRLAALAAGLGSDVRFALAAMRGDASAVGSAVATGYGEQLEPVASRRPVHAALVLPPLRCATSAVYAAFDRLRPHAPPPEVARVRAMALTGDTAGLFNELSDAAEHVEPRLREVRDAVERAVGTRPHVTGSGAACFLVADGAEEARAMAERVRERVGVACVATSGYSDKPVSEP